MRTMQTLERNKLKMKNRGAEAPSNIGDLRSCLRNKDFFNLRDIRNTALGTTGFKPFLQAARGAQALQSSSCRTVGRKLTPTSCQSWQCWIEVVTRTQDLEI